MPITVRLMGDLGRFTESPTVELEGGRRSVAEVLEELIRRYPPLQTELFVDPAKLRSAVLVVMGGRPFNWPADKGVMIEDGSELLLMRFLAGG